METPTLPDCTIIVFGITGNLAQIKLLPAIYDLIDKKLLSPDSRIIGVGRTVHSNESFENYLSEVLHSPNHHHNHPVKDATINKLLKRVIYISGNVDSNHPDNVYPKLEDELKKNGSGNILYYLSTYPELYAPIFSSLKKYSLNKVKKGWARIMIEKPFGDDLLSAKKLDLLLHKYFSEKEIYRIDHFLGKETLQHILTFRFGNDLFEPLMNKDYLDNIQITASEEFGIGKRGEYYDKVGALKDVGQNHLLQMLSIATMEAPTQFTNEAVTQKRLDIVSTLIADPKSLVLGQYKGYRNEEKVLKNSKADTFFAFKTYINSPRYEGVPIYVRGGKKLKRNVSQITFVFKSPVNRLFNDISGKPISNVLFYRLQPNEGIGVEFLTKTPGHKMATSPAFMEYCYRRSVKDNIPDAYEKLIYAAINGEQTFFNDASEVEAQWAFVDKLTSKKHKVYEYNAGTWGPKAADKLIKKDGRLWITPSEDFCRI